MLMLIQKRYKIKKVKAKEDVELGWGDGGGVC